MWLGPDPLEASAAYGRARRAGMSATRALVVGQIASFRDCWAFRARLARIVGASVRTVQRAISEAKSLGLIGVARAKQGETAPGLERAVPCGWSHRWTIGRGLALGAVQKAIEAARTKFLRRTSLAGGVVRTSKPPAPSRRWTAEEISRELERRDRDVSARVAEAHRESPADELGGVGGRYGPPE